jgi:hypothetical protein
MPNMSILVRQENAMPRESSRSNGRVIVELEDIYTHEKTIHEVRNLLTTAYRSEIAQWLASADAAINPINPTHIAVGTGAFEQYAETNQDSDAEVTGSGNDQRLAQGFQDAAAQTVHAVYLWLKRTGTPGGNCQVEIQTNTGAVPTGTVVTNGASDLRAIDGLATTYDWVKFTFATPPSLLAATTYHIVLKADGGYSYVATTAELEWGTDESAPSYASGAASQWNGASWAASSPAADRCFRIVPIPAVGNTTIVDETARKALTSASNPAGNKARLLANFTASQAVGRHGMAGLLNAAAGGDLLALANVDIKKENTQTMNIYWVIEVL